MATPFVGEIRLFAGGYAPQGWAACNGQVLPITQYEVLYTLIGTTYGGDGQSTFALPDLRSRVPVCAGNPYRLGQKGGVETVTLSSAQLPAHNHGMRATSANGDSNDPTNRVWGFAPASTYSTASSDSNLDPSALSAAGGGQPHDNMLPFVALSFIIALNGIFPSQG
jgi:microcystin-dependent protein